MQNYCLTTATSTYFPQVGIVQVTDSSSTPLYLIACSPQVNSALTPQTDYLVDFAILFFIGLAVLSFIIKYLSKYL